MTVERELSAGMATAVAGELLRPFLLFEGEFASGTGRWWTGVGDLSWNGETWVGLGSLVGLSELGESVETKAEGFTVTLSGQDPDLLALALSACRQGASGKIWLGALDESGAVIPDPYLLRQGWLDVPSGQDGGDTATISVSYEDELIDLERPRDFRYTTETQRLFYPDDKGFDFVPSLQDAVDVW